MVDLDLFLLYPINSRPFRASFPIFQLNFIIILLFFDKFIVLGPWRARSTSARRTWSTSTSTTSSNSERSSATASTRSLFPFSFKYFFFSLPFYIFYVFIDESKLMNAFYCLPLTPRPPVINKVTISRTYSLRFRCSTRWAFRRITIRTISIFLPAFSSRRPPEATVPSSPSRPLDPFTTLYPFFDLLFSLISIEIVINYDIFRYYILKSL